MKATTLKLTVLSHEAAVELSEPYREGWLDGRNTPCADFTENVRLARWDDPEDRLKYYRGHRDGSRGYYEAGESSLVA